MSNIGVRFTRPDDSTFVQEMLTAGDAKRYLRGNKQLPGEIVRRTDELSPRETFAIEQAPTVATLTAEHRDRMWLDRNGSDWEWGTNWWSRMHNMSGWDMWHRAPKNVADYGPFTEAGAARI